LHALFFCLQKQIRRYNSYYKERYGRVTEFKAALHGGTVVISEVGKYKSEIAYRGDVLNAIASMLGKCHELGSELPKYLKADQMETFQLKGKIQEMGLRSVYIQKRDSLIQTRRRFFKQEKAKKHYQLNFITNFCCWI